MRSNRATWSWMILEFIGSAILLFVLTYAVVDYKEELNQNRQFLLKQHEIATSEMVNFFHFVNSAANKAEQELILYNRRPSDSSLGKLHDALRIIVTLHEWIEQITIIKTNHTILTSSDLFRIHPEPYQHAEWLEKLRQTEDIQISLPLYSQFGITHGQEVLLIGKQLTDIRGQIIGFIVFTLYPDAFFSDLSRKKLNVAGMVQVERDSGVVIVKEGMDTKDNEFVATTPLPWKSIRLTSSVVPLQVGQLGFWGWQRGLAVIGALSAIMLISLGLYFRHEQILTQRLQVSELEEAVHRRTRDLQQAKQLLEESQYSLIKAQEISHMGNWEWNIEREKLIWTDEIYRIFGYQPGEIESTYEYFVKALHPDDRQKVVTEINQSLADPDHLYKVDHRIVWPDGTLRYVQEMGEVLRNSEGEATRMLGIIHDITELKLAELDAEQARISAEQASQAKSEFLANMSHEIRTPMSSIIGMSELLSESRLSKEQLEYVNRISKSGDDLIRIINDILDLSKVEAGLIELEEINFSLGEVIDKIFSVFFVKAEKKSILLKKRIAPDIQDIFLGDPIRLRQVLINLVGNALKFTESGEISISVESGGEFEQNQTNCLLFSVTDTGIGIPEYKLETIFDEFSQVDTSTTRIYGGTGLGLAISRKLVELMGGKLTVQSKEGEGSSFYFVLNLKGGNAEEELSIEPTIDKRGVKEHPLKILLAEDTEDNRLLVQSFLKNTPHSLDMVENGEIAVEQFIGNNYDLVFMDMQMPIMDGYTATRIIRGWEKRNDREKTPVIAFTAHALKEEVQKCLEAGCTDHFSKPFKKKKLQELVQSYSLSQE